jgi:hypothetical protein
MDSVGMNADCRLRNVDFKSEISNQKSEIFKIKEILKCQEQKVGTRPEEDGKRF